MALYDNMIIYHIVLYILKLTLEKNQSTFTSNQAYYNFNEIKLHATQLLFTNLNFLYDSLSWLQHNFKMIKDLVTSSNFL